jgi:hypothetical protein
MLTNTLQMHIKRAPIPFSKTPPLTHIHLHYFRQPKTQATTITTMQFTTTLLTLALAAAGVSAAPNPAAGLAVRQVPNLVYVRFYQGGGCQEPWIEDGVFYDDGTGTCLAQPFSGTYGSFQIISNDATRSCKFFECPHDLSI